MSSRTTCPSSVVTIIIALILFNSINRLRKKLFIDYIIYFIIFYPPSQLVCPKTIKCIPPLRSPTVALRNLSLPRRARVFFWLVVV